MSAPPKSRSRAVRLTPEALAALQGALVGRWQESQRPGKLTNEAKAEMLDVAKGTAEKILSGKGVDRSSLAHAFKSLGLAWDDACCVPVAGESEAAPTEEPAPPAPAAPESPSRARNAFVVAALLGLALLAVGWVVASSRAMPPAEAWIAQYDAAMRDAGARYDRADYTGSETQLQKALLLARRLDSTNRLAYVTHVQGVHAQERGNFEGAKALYLRGEAMRIQAGSVGLRPVIDQALGEVETLLGNYAAARRHLDRSLKGFREIRDPVGMAMATRDLGSVALTEGGLDEADALLLRSLKLVEGLGKADLEADVRGRQAMVLLARGKPREARTLLKACLDHWRSKNHPRWIAASEMRLAQADARLNDRAGAAQRLTRSKAAFERLQDAAGAAEAASHLSRLASPPPPR